MNNNYNIYIISFDINSNFVIKLKQVVLSDMKSMYDQFTRIVR